MNVGSRRRGDASLHVQRTSASRLLLPITLRGADWLDFLGALSGPVALGIDRLVQVGVEWAITFLRLTPPLAGPPRRLQRGIIRAASLAGSNPVAGVWVSMGVVVMEVEIARLGQGAYPPPLDRDHRECGRS